LNIKFERLGFMEIDMKTRTIDMNMNSLKDKFIDRIIKSLILLVATSACTLNASEIEELPLSATPAIEAVIAEVVAEAEGAAETEVTTETKVVAELVQEPKPVFELDQPVALSVEQLKKKVIQLNRDLFILEEDLLFPANTQFVVYLSIASGQFLQLDSVTLKIDDQVSSAHLYTQRQIKALQRGGMQRLHLGNLKEGAHQITAIVNGIGPDKRAYKLAASLDIHKDSEIKSLEVRIEDQAANFQPSVNIIEWDASH